MDTWKIIRVRILHILATLVMEWIGVIMLYEEVDSVFFLKFSLTTKSKI